MEAIKIECQSISGDALDSYVPTEQFQSLRKLWGEGLEAGELIVIRISFRNEGVNPVEMIVENSACKFEFQNLEVIDSKGSRVMPGRNLHVRPQVSNDLPRKLNRNSVFEFDLIGEILDGFIVFPGAKYSIPDDGVLDGKFNYKGLNSEVFTLISLK